jgi:RNA polymerase sigma-70 factor (ECF subfamily)
LTLSGSRRIVGQSTVTELLQAWGRGDISARDELVPAVYEELRRQAHRYLQRERPGHTLETTGLVHEAYIRLVDQRQADWQNRAHFFGIAGQMMRRVLIDYARSKQAVKRGGGGIQVTLEDAMAAAEARGIDLLDLDESLTRLAELDPQQAKVVELRYFAGLGIEETAQALEISPATVKREWAMARAWLRRDLAQDPQSDPPAS